MYVCGMNQLSTEKRVQMLHCFCEGMSLRATGRLCDVAIVTVLKFYLKCGEACERYQDEAFKALRCHRVQLDEVWAFCHAKAKNVPTAKTAPVGAGDIWTWTAMDADSRLIFAWETGKRDSCAADAFMHKVKERTATKPQITSDGLNLYLSAVENHFGGNAHFAQLVKVFSGDQTNIPVRYSPPVCIGTKKHIISGTPDAAHISTSYNERGNLSLRMHNRRFTRLTNGFSKKARNHALGVAITYFYLNFVKINSTLRCTPAMQAGVTSRVWEVADMVAILEQWEKAA